MPLTSMLYTGGAAKCDAFKLGLGNISDKRLVYWRNKFRRKPEGIEVNIPICPYLAATLAHLPSDAFTFLQTQTGCHGP